MSAMKDALRWFRTRLGLEISLIAVFALVIYAISVENDLFEWMVEFSRDHEDWELDEVFVAIFFSSVTLSLVLYRVMRYLNTEYHKRVRAEEKIHKMAFFDDLTGLANRALCHDRLAHVVLHSKRFNLQAAVLFIDLDGFKAINDAYGHHVGDSLLIQTGKRLSSFLRGDDTLARMSGDEFVLIVQSIKQATDITNLAAKLVQVMEEPFTLSSGEAFVTCSIGIAIYPTDGKTVEELLQNADSAMYHAKNRGKNTFEFFSASIDLEAKRKLQLMTQLRQALANREFSLHYQPILDVCSGRITGCETLLRWTSSLLGPVSPVEFIPVAEESGLILSLGDWVLLQSCKQHMQWQKMGLPPLMVSVNLSAKQLWQRNYVDSVKCILEVTGMQAKYLELELTESAVIEDIDLVMDTLEDLKELGVSIALDDFGTGYSSIGYLRKLSLHRVKIDRCFIDEIPHNDDDVATTKAIISLARNLRLKVTAEGIENAAQWEFLKQIKCDCMQGFYFSRAVTGDEFARIYRQNTADTAWPLKVSV